MSLAPELPEPLAAPVADVVDPQPLALPASGGDPALAPIGVALAAGFLATRALMSATLREQSAPTSEGATRALLTRLWQRFTPIWLKMAVAPIAQAYELGAVGQRALTLAETNALAEDYALTLGDALHQVSAEAMLQGFYGHLRSGFSERLAWERASTGYGLDTNQFRTWMSAVTAEPRNIVATSLSMASQATLDKLLMARADRIGRTESYHAAQVGKSVFWLMAQARGDLPADTRKKWITARDERVCPVCGPLDGQEVELSERFAVDGADLWAPGAHPNCRCEIELVYDTTIVIPDDAAELLSDVALAKADYGKKPDGSRYWNVRDEEGEFATRTERAKPKRRLQVLDRETTEELQQVAATVAPVVNPFDVATEPVNAFDVATNAFDQVAQATSAINAFDEAVQVAGAKNAFDAIVETADPFTDAAIEAMNTTRRKIRRLIIVNGQMQMVEEEVEVNNEGFNPERAYMFASGFLTAYYQHLLKEAGSQSNSIKLPIYENAVIDISFQDQFDPNITDIPAGRPAMLEDPAAGEEGTIEEILTEEGADFVEHANRVAESVGYYGQSATDERIQYLMDDAGYDLGSWLDSVGIDGQESIIHEAIRYGGDIYDESSRLTYRDWIMWQIENDDRAYQSVVDENIYEWAMSQAESALAYDHVDSTVGAQERPTIFKFEGFRGGTVDSRYAAVGQEAFVEGEYLVKKVEVIKVSDRVRQIMQNRRTAPFDSYRLITLVPKPLYNDTEA